MQNKNMTIQSTLPTLNKVYAPLDIVGQTLGRYLDYKKETAMIEHETIKIKKQTEILLAEIDSRLQLSLDNNKRNFKLEMNRLKVIARELKSGNRTQNYHYKNIEELTKMLSNPDIELSIKATIPSLIAMAHESIGQKSQLAMQKLSLMSSTQPNQILIEER